MNPKKEKNRGPSFHHYRIPVTTLLNFCSCLLLIPFPLFYTMSRHGAIVCDPHTYFSLSVSTSLHCSMLAILPIYPRFCVHGNVKIITLQSSITLGSKAKTDYGGMCCNRTLNFWLSCSWKSLRVLTCFNSLQHRILQNFLYSLTLSPDFRACPSVQIPPSPGSKFPRQGSAMSNITYSLGSWCQSSWEWSCIQMVCCQQIVLEWSWPFSVRCLITLPGPETSTISCIEVVLMPSKLALPQPDPMFAAQQCIESWQARWMSTQVVEEMHWRMDKDEAGHERRDLLWLPDHSYLMHPPQSMSSTIPIASPMTY